MSKHGDRWTSISHTFILASKYLTQLVLAADSGRPCQSRNGFLIHDEA